MTKRFPRYVKYFASCQVHFVDDLVPGGAPMVVVKPVPRKNGKIVYEKEFLVKASKSPLSHRVYSN